MNTATDSTAATRDTLRAHLQRDTVNTEDGIAYYDALVAAFMKMPAADLEAMRKVDGDLSDEGREALFSVALQLAFDARLRAPAT